MEAGHIVVETASIAINNSLAKTWAYAYKFQGG